MPPSRRCSNRRAAPPLRERTSTGGHVRNPRQAAPQSFGSLRPGPIGGISDKGLWVDDQPGLAFRAENVARVQVGSQQKLYGFRAWQLRKETQTFLD